MNDRPQPMNISEVPITLNTKDNLNEEQKARAAACWQAARILSCYPESFSTAGIICLGEFIYSGLYVEEE